MDVAYFQDLPHAKLLKLAKANRVKTRNVKVADIIGRLVELNKEGNVDFSEVRESGAHRTSRHISSSKGQVTFANGDQTAPDTPGTASVLSSDQSQHSYGDGSYETSPVTTPRPASKRDLDSIVQRLAGIAEEDERRRELANDLRKKIEEQQEKASILREMTDALNIHRNRLEIHFTYWTHAQPRWTHKRLYQSETISVPRRAQTQADITKTAMPAVDLRRVAPPVLDDSPVNTNGKRVRVNDAEVVEGKEEAGVRKRPKTRKIVRPKAPAPNDQK